MSATKLSDAEQAYLLGLARQTIQRAVNGEEIPVIQENDLTPVLRAPGASFVTLTKHGDLRGCIGALEAYQPLAYDVREHAAAAALEDYRFPPVKPDEVSSIQIEISRLTPPQKMDYDSPENLPGILRPGIDGVILKDNFRRATFLPQVWEKLPEPEQFLAHLCQKMGAPSDLWKRKLLQVWVYQVEEFHE